MLGLENPEEVLMILDRYRTLKQKNIPKELDEYLSYVAKTGDPVYNWSTIQYLFREKLTTVIREFHDTTPSLDELPPCPNVDAFNYENLKTALLERLDLFHAAPFTVQRLCELLTNPKKHYCRLDKFMRALEKNILVVSTIEPGRKKAESENGDSVSLDVSLDSDIERDNSSGPASANDSLPVALKANDAPEDEAADKEVAGQSTQIDADDSIIDDGDVEVKDSLESLPSTVDDAKEVEVDDKPTDTVVENPVNPAVEEVHIDVVEENKDEKEAESVCEASPPVLAEETERTPTENETETNSAADEIGPSTATTLDAQLPSEEDVVIADSSVPDATPAVESLPETVESVKKPLEVESEGNDAISSSVDVTASVEESTVNASSLQEDEDSECGPSSAKIRRLELNDVDTTTVTDVSAATVTVPDQPVEEIDSIDDSALPISDDSTQEPNSTSSEVILATEEPTAVAPHENIAPEAIESKTIEADSTEPENKIAIEDSIADTPVATSDPIPEAIITESNAETIEEPTEVASSDDIAEVMAVEEEPASITSAVDSTAATILAPVAVDLVVADTTAMDATPIIPSDEQMDVDEANSADSMDL